MEKPKFRIFFNGHTKEFQYVMALNDSAFNLLGKKFSNCRKEIELPKHNFRNKI